MYRQFGGGNFGTTFDRTDAAVAPIARSGALDALVALERIGSRRNFARDEEIYGEGDTSNCRYNVVAGTVRITKLLADGRRHVAESVSAAIVLASTTPPNGYIRPRR